MVTYVCPPHLNRSSEDCLSPCVNVVQYHRSPWAPLEPARLHLTESHKGELRLSMFHASMFHASMFQRQMPSRRWLWPRAACAEEVRLGGPDQNIGSARRSRRFGAVLALPCSRSVHPKALALSRLTSPFQSGARLDPTVAVSGSRIRCSVGLSDCRSSTLHISQESSIQLTDSQSRKSNHGGMRQTRAPADAVTSGQVLGGAGLFTMQSR